jgi:phosphatidylserine decarboxylase
LSIINSIQKTIFVPIHPAGHPFILISFVSTAVLIFFVGQIAGFFGIIFSVWCVYFFRNPVRYTPQHNSLVISPADGRILSINKNKPPESLGLEGNDYTKISIFMNVFDVHVNRAPMSGKVFKKE